MGYDKYIAHIFNLELQREYQHFTPTNLNRIITIHPSSL